MHRQEPNLNPGESLRNLLMDLYPKDSQSQSSFVNKVDRAFLEEGQLASLLHQSTINYMIRRLITTAKFIRRGCEKNGLSENVIINQLRSHLENEMELPVDKIELILVLLLECSKLKRKDSLASARRKAGRKRWEKCSICGRELDYDSEGNDDSVTMDHRWPNALGGLNDNDNLVAVCHKCNNKKGDYIDASDFHYEQICLKSDRSEDSFSTEMRYEYMIALWTKSNFQCSRCSKPASTIGRLEFARSDTKDSWHFLNIEVYCSHHYPKAQRTQ